MRFTSIYVYLTTFNNVVYEKWDNLPLTNDAGNSARMAVVSKTVQTADKTLSLKSVYREHFGSHQVRAP